jgi:beta-carotene 3-hydroxylase
MEGVAWFTHKYIMHGLLWYFHKDHHTRDNKGFFEKNDFFFLIFAVPGSIFIMYGIEVGLENLPFWIGLGITTYGAAYFFVHDLFIHQRIKVLRKTRNRYLLGIRKGHKIHHKEMAKENGECFGMLLVPLKYFKLYK